MEPLKCTSVLIVQFIQMWREIIYYMKTGTWAPVGVVVSALVLCARGFGF